MGQCDQPRSDLAALAVVSVDVVLLVDEEDEVSELVVPLAPMLDVPLELGAFAVLLLDVLGVELVVPEAPIVLELFLLASVLLYVLEALVPPESPLEPLVPPVCAIAMPPTARAAAAARVVSVFFVVVMSCSLNETNPRRGRVDGKPAHCRLELD
jgi:hypothetical protein